MDALVNKDPRDEKKVFVTGAPGRGGGDSHIIVTRMLVVSLCCVNCRFWSHLGCLAWKVSIFANSGTT